VLHTSTRRACVQAFNSSVLPVTPVRIAVPRSNNTAVFDFKAFAHPLKSTVTDICSLSFFWLRAPDSGSLARGLWLLAPSLPPSLSILLTHGLNPFPAVQSCIVQLREQYSLQDLIYSNFILLLISTASHLTPRSAMIYKTSLQSARQAHVNIPNDLLQTSSLLGPLAPGPWPLAPGPWPLAPGLGSWDSSSCPRAGTLPMPPGCTKPCPCYPAVYEAAWSIFFDRR
jgi:hypothetical protein